MSQPGGGVLPPLAAACLPCTFHHTLPSSAAACSMHAYALELLLDQLRPGAKVLDVGSGTG